MKNKIYMAMKLLYKINDEIVVFRKKARVMLVIEMCLAVAAYFIDFVSIACSALLALITADVLMSAELLNKRRR